MPAGWNDCRYRSQLPRLKIVIFIYFRDEARKQTMDKIKVEQNYYRGRVQQTEHFSLLSTYPRQVV